MSRARSGRLVLATVFCVGLGAFGGQPALADELPPAAGPTTPGHSELLTHQADGSPTDHPSQSPSSSGDGEWIAFASEDNHLVAGESIRGRQLYLMSVSTGEVQLVSRALNGKGGNDLSQWARVSDDGRYVVFTSRATDLIPAGRRLDGYAAYLRDMVAGTTTLLATGRAGRPAPGESWGGDISGDGRFVLFDSEAPRLVRRDHNDARDVFLLDRLSGARTLVSHTPSGRSRGTSYAGHLSSDGNVATMRSYADNLVKGIRIKYPRYADVYVHDVNTDETVLVNRSMSGPRDVYGGAYGAEVSADGSRVAFVSSSGDLAPGGAPEKFDAFLYDIDSDALTLLSRAADGGPPDGATTSVSLSADGALAALGSDATNLVTPAGDRTGDVFRVDVGTGATERLTRGAYRSSAGAPPVHLSDDGQTVVFVAQTKLDDEDHNRFLDIYRWSAS